MTDFASVNLLLVCHANLCRSPMAQRLAQRRFEDAGMAGEAVPSVASAGTHATSGLPMHAYAEQALREYGVEAGQFRGRRLTVDLVRGAELILTADRAQRGHCVGLVPSVRTRVFTLRQFARLSQHLSGPGSAGGQPTQASVNLGLQSAPGSARLAAVALAVNAARSRVQPVPGALDDLPDPIGKPLDAFRECAGELDAILGQLVAAIMGCPSPRR